MDVPIRLGDLSSAHRGRIADILRATGAFSDEEVAVGIELFDETFSLSGIENSSRRVGLSAESRSNSRFPIPDSRISNPDYSFLGAFTPDDELIGYACYGPTPGTEGTYDLYWIAVDPAAHGTGIGTILLSEVERRLEGHRARLLVVETSSRSDYAQTRNFYGRRGFAESARVRGFYAPGDDRIIFTKRFQISPTGRGAQSP